MRRQANPYTHSETAVAAIIRSRGHFGPFSKTELIFIAYLSQKYQQEQNALHEEEARRIQMSSEGIAALYRKILIHETEALQKTFKNEHEKFRAKITAFKAINALILDERLQYQVFLQCYRHNLGKIRLIENAQKKYDELAASHDTFLLTTKESFQREKLTLEATSESSQLKTFEHEVALKTARLSFLFSQNEKLYENYCHLKARFSACSQLIKLHESQIEKKLESKELFFYKAIAALIAAQHSESVNFLYQQAINDLSLLFQQFQDGIKAYTPEKTASHPTTQRAIPLTPSYSDQLTALVEEEKNQRVALGLSLIEQRKTFFSHIEPDARPLFYYSEIKKYIKTFIEEGRLTNHLAIFMVKFKDRCTENAFLLIRGNENLSFTRICYAGRLFEETIKATSPNDTQKSKSLNTQTAIPLSNTIIMHAMIKKFLSGRKPTLFGLKFKKGSPDFNQRLLRISYDTTLSERNELLREFSTDYHRIPFNINTIPFSPDVISLIDTLIDQYDDYLSLLTLTYNTTLKKLMHTKHFSVSAAMLTDITEICIAGLKKALHESSFTLLQIPINYICVALCKTNPSASLPLKLETLGETQFNDTNAPQLSFGEFMKCRMTGQWAFSGLLKDLFLNNVSEKIKEKHHLDLQSMLYEINIPVLSLADLVENHLPKDAINPLFRAPTATAASTPKPS